MNVKLSKKSIDNNIFWCVWDGVPYMVCKAYKYCANTANKKDSPTWELPLNLKSVPFQILFFCLFFLFARLSRLLCLEKIPDLCKKHYVHRWLCRLFRLFMLAK